MIIKKNLHLIKLDTKINILCRNSILFFITFVLITKKTSRGFPRLIFYISGTMIYISIYVPSVLLLVALVLDVSALLNLLKIDLENVILPSDSLTILEEDENSDDIKDIVILHQKLLRF